MIRFQLGMLWDAKFIGDGGAGYHTGPAYQSEFATEIEPFPVATGPHFGVALRYAGSLAHSGAVSGFRIPGMSAREVRNSAVRRAKIYDVFNYLDHQEAGFCYRD
jgi:hypothetical protein